jgi:transcriptional regulator with XRE-family HTH domain
MILTSERCKAARRLLGWSLMALANRSPVSETTLRNFEKAKTTPTPFKLMAIRRAFEAAGIEFDDKSDGARLRKVRS